MIDKKPRLGELLLETGVLQKEQLDDALALQKKRQLRLGTILLQEAFVSEPQLVQALSRRLSIPWVNLWHIDIDDDLLDLVPASVAEEFFLIPIYIRTTGSGERALYVAMNDPTDDSALRFVAAASGMTVKPMIAAPSDISAAIRAYYYGEEEPSLAPAPPPISQLQQGRGTAVPPPPQGMTNKPDAAKPPLPPAPGQPQRNGEPAPPTASPPEAPPVASKPETPPEENSGQKEDKSPSPPETSAESSGQDPAATIEVEDEEKRVSAPPEIPEAAKNARPTGDRNKAQREVEKHMFGVGGGDKRRGISLTLLDGTTIDFGVAAQKPEQAQEAKPKTMTQDDFVAALAAAKAGSGPQGLPSENWQDYMAALLQIMFKKHLVFFNEFIKEIEKIKESKS